ncbi:hypothetical protein ARAM_006579 [Aspergillus rambellii]|uniref:A-pheromone receptor PreA n=1 Tax=Aspergillus rambellii TaxID=308745 RepID=A0A0F8VFU6_9EURO|nr:hypothetical protein ARAM_006579 [Aspergillus rambellii]
MSSAPVLPYPQAVAIQTLSAIAILISLPPLVLHWKNRNFPAASLICWFLVLDLFNITNAFIWPGDDIENWWDGEGLCDVEVKILTGAYAAIPGTLVCIFRNLAAVLDTRRATLVPTKRQRRQSHGIELMFCLGIPLITALLHMVYQGNRYFIFAISGCVTGLDESWVSLALGYIWPLVICLIGNYYCGLVLYRLHRYRSQFGDIIRSANSGLNKSRFLRLFSLSFVMMLALTPTQAFMVYRNISLNLPWHSYSWTYIHDYAWYEIVKVPTNGEVFFDRWIPVIAGFMSFIFFGCGKDALSMYRSILRFFGLDCCFRTPQSSSAGSFAQNTSRSSGSRVRLLFARNSKQNARGIANTSCRTDSSNGSYEDIEKGSPPSEPSKRPGRFSWPKSPFSWLRHPFSSSSHKGIPSAPRLAVPSNTVSTSAWAGSSQSRGSIDLNTSPTQKDFIRVKQVIRQESKVRV